MPRQYLMVVYHVQLGMVNVLAFKELLVQHVRLMPSAPRQITAPVVSVVNYLKSAVAPDARQGMDTAWTCKDRGKGADGTSSVHQEIVVEDDAARPLQLMDAFTATRWGPAAYGKPEDCVIPMTNVRVATVEAHIVAQVPVESVMRAP